MNVSSDSKAFISAKATRLAAWFSEAAIKYDRVALFSNEDMYSGDALGIHAIEDIEEGSVIATVPKASVISARTSSLGPFLEEHKIGGAYVTLNMLGAIQP